MPYSALHRAVHAVVEASYAAANPVFASGATLLLEEFSCSPMEGTTVEREPAVNDGGTRRKIPGPVHAKATGKVSLTARAAADTPSPARALLLAGGFAENVTAGVSVAYTMVARPTGSAALLYNDDGHARTLLGVRCGVSVEFEKEKPPMLSVEAIALYGAKAAAAPIAQDFAAWLEPELAVANVTTFTLGGTSLAMEKATIKADNLFAYQNRPGQERVVQERRSRNSMATVTVLDEDRATFDPETLRRSGATVAMDLQHGSGAGKRVRIQAPAAQVVGVKETEVQGQRALELELLLTSPPGTTADWSLLLS